MTLGGAPVNRRYSSGLPCTRVASTVPPPRSAAASRTWNAPYPSTRSEATGPPTVSAGANGVMTVFADAVGAAALTCSPAAIGCSASGGAHNGWLSGPVSAEVHHWFVGSAAPLRSGPA